MGFEPPDGLDPGIALPVPDLFGPGEEAPPAVRNDTDGDGLADAEEIGSDPFAADSDGDGIGDLTETAYDRARCATTTEACGCAASAACAPAEDFRAAVLPHGEAAVVDVALSATVRQADVFFLLDSGATMSGGLSTAAAALLDHDVTPRIASAAPDVQMGLGRHEDFPFPGYGGPDDDSRTWWSTVRSWPACELPVAER